MSKALVFALSVLLSGCSGLEITTSEAKITPLAPPLPAAVFPFYPKPRILTPGVTEVMNGDVATGEEVPYTYFCFSDQEWLSLGEWRARYLQYVKGLRYVLELMKHPELTKGKIDD